MSAFVTIFVSLLTASSSHSSERVSCGADDSPMTMVYEGIARIQYYPWLGILYYPAGRKRFTTVVALVTRQLVIAAAAELDNLPKDHFRARSRVILGHNCSGPTIRVRDYVYHPHFTTRYSEMALIQLDVDHVTQDLRPICPPPSHFIDPEFYAMTLEKDCKKSLIRIHRMNYVDRQECKQYYRKSGLDMDSMWPTHTVCAKGKYDDNRKCVWRSGTLLVTRQGDRWHLLGFGIYGPGCAAPARFFDYGQYHKWVKTNIARIGLPAVTRVAGNYLVLRRTRSNLQRFGPCDLEETKTELYSDQTNVSTSDDDSFSYRRLRFNVTLYANVEYSCVTFRVLQDRSIHSSPPILRLRRWCAGPRTICHDFQFLEIHFYVELYFVRKVVFKMRAYGKEAKTIDAMKAMVYANRLHIYPKIGNISDVLKMLPNHEYKWFS